MTARAAREWALLYASLGWRVFPVVPGGKRPMYRGWQRDATRDASLVARYWRTEPGPNIGIVCGEAFIAFDIEAPHLEALGAWTRSRGLALPDTPTARTGRGGIHLLVRPSDISGRLLRLDGTHIGELKSEGGFIVACPSRTEGPYAWLRSPEEVGVADAPEWLEDLALTPRREVARTSTAQPLGPSRAVVMATGLYRVVADASEGERNRILYWASRRVADHGLDRVAASEILLAAAIRAGLPEREARSTIESGLSG